MNARNGFANILRTRVEEAHRIDVLKVPLKLETQDRMMPSKSQAAINRERIAKAKAALGVKQRAPPAGKRPPPVPTNNTRKKAWHENIAVPHLRGDNKKPIAQIIAGNKGRKAPPANGGAGRRDVGGGDASSGRGGGRKVLSSGYGGGRANSVAKERVLKKIAGAMSAPSLTAMVASQNAAAAAPMATGNVARRLRSKCSIDVLETIEETRRNANEANGKRSGKSGIRSAPLGSSQRSNASKEGDSKPALKKSTSAQQMPAQSMSALGKLNKKGGGSPPKAHPNSYLATQRTDNRQPASNASPQYNPQPAAAPSRRVPSVLPTPGQDTHYGEPIHIDTVTSSSNSPSIAPSGIISPSLKSSSQYFISNSMMDFADVTPTVLSPNKSSKSSHSQQLQAGPVSAASNNHNITYEEDLDDHVRRSENEYADIQSSIERLKQFGNHGDEKAKKDVNVNLLSKKAVKLGSHFNNADDLMSKYRNLVNEFD
eukprot:gene30292-37483_t